MITTLILSKVMDYIFFIGLLWVAFFIYGIIKRVSTGSPVELKTLFIITEVIFLLCMLTDAANNKPLDWILIAVCIAMIIWEISDIKKYKNKKAQEASQNNKQQ